MKSSQIFIGNIKKCTKYQTFVAFSGNTYINDQCTGCDQFGYIETNDEIYKENAILIKIGNSGYVDLERLHSILDYIKIHQDIKNGYHLGGLIMPTSAYHIDSLFVDRKSLKPYYSDKQQVNNVSVLQLKKQIKKY